MKLPELNYTTPVAFTRKQHLQLAILPPLIVNLLKGLLLTCRHEVRNLDYLTDTIESHGHGILAAWHESVAYVVYNHVGSNYHSASSFSFDGELAARLTHGFNIECVRGSSSRGGAGVLHQLEIALGLVDCVGLTMDGPRGPRRHAQPGVAILSARTGVPVVPVAVSISRSWRLGTWDRMTIPKPFSKVIIDYAPPIAPAKSTDRDAINAKRTEIQDTLNALHVKLEAELGDVQQISPAPGSAPRP
ncbi:MAG: lysophospholipid acyltransferase family protein [Candidatus Hydrogenedentes bacterium]|nr:lysophospholipid acyltransferase family protein [Candidatus Hydrogenedentota bacterium]